MSARRVALTAVALLALFLAYQAGGASARHSRDGLLEEAVTAISRNGAAKVDPDALRRAAVEGMLRASGDRWSSYYDKSAFATFNETLSGRYIALGLWLRPGKTGGTEVASVQPDSSAARAGVKADDAIVLLDGRDVASESVSSLIALLRGEAGDRVSLGVVRKGDLKLFTLTRESATTNDVAIDRIDEQTLLIRISAFSSGVGSEVRRAATSLKHNGGIILDLRGNSGGLLEEARQVASVFLDGGVVVSYERRGLAPKILNAEIGGDTKTPLVVIVDAQTASAAEVLAAALQDRNRAVVVGQRTYGKGSVQEPQLLSDGSAIELTVGRYRTPSGRYLEGVGLEPDVNATPSQMEQRSLQILSALRSVNR